jgi:protein-S-isoprenylcysteine O-methyltransferase
MDLRGVLGLAVVTFPVSEIGIALFKRGPRSAKVDDRGSQRLLWLVIICSVGLAVAVSGLRATEFRFGATIPRLAAACLLLGGLALRWASILTLGRYFTADVATQGGQTVVTAGPYRHVRHPSYTGLLLAFLGLGVFFGNWLSLAVLMVPVTLAMFHRIRLEETVLTGTLGPAYAAYCARTKRLIPGIL